MASTRLAGLVVMCAAPFGAVTLMAAEPGASVAEQVFVDRLHALVETRRWADAARHVQQAQALRPVPEWLVRRDGDLRHAQIRIGLGQLDLPAAVTAARFFLNGDEARAQQVLAIARGARATGDVTAAVALAKEILRRSPDFAPAERALAEWEPVADKKTPAIKETPPAGQDEATTLLAQLRSAHESDNFPAMLAAARLFLTGDRGRAARLLEVAREYFAQGHKPAALLLTREVVRRTPDFPPAERQLEEFRTVEKK